MATGNERFKQNFKSAMTEMREGAIKGLRLGVKLVEYESKVRTPVDEGNLKGGTYSTVVVSKSRAIGEFGNTVEYAAFVHEMTNPSSGVPRKGGKGLYWETGRPKFLKSAIDDKIDEVVDLVRKMAKIV